MKKKLFQVQALQITAIQLEKRLLNDEVKKNNKEYSTRSKNNK